MRRSHLRAAGVRTSAWGLRLALGAGLALATVALPGAGPSSDGAAVDVAGPAVPPVAAEPAPEPPYLGFYAPPDRPLAVVSVPERRVRPVPATPEPPRDRTEPSAPASATEALPQPAPAALLPDPAPSGGLAAAGVEMIFDPLAGVRPSLRLPVLRSRVAGRGTVQSPMESADPGAASDTGAPARPAVAPASAAPIAAASPATPVPLPRSAGSARSAVSDVAPPSRPGTTPPSARTSSALPLAASEVAQAATTKGASAQPAPPAPSEPPLAARPASPRIPETASATAASAPTPPQAPQAPQAASPLGTGAAPPAPAAPAFGGPAPVPAKPPAVLVASATDVEDLRPPAVGASTLPGVAIAPRGRLGGTGRLGDVRNDGTLAPGHSPGLVEIAGDLVQSASGSLDIELGGTDAEDYDRILVEGAISLSGELHVVLIDGFEPEVGDVFDVLEGDSIALDGLAIFLPALDGGRSLVAGVAAVGDRSVFRIATFGVTPVPEPASGLLLAGGLAALTTLSRRARAGASPP